MQNLKRALSLVLVLAMVATLMLSAVAAPAKQLTDLSEAEYQPEVQVLNALNIIEGYEDGTYKPEKAVSRAELATILARICVGGDKEMIRTYDYASMKYTDVLSANYGWAAPAIQFCTDKGIVAGDGNNNFRPSDTVTIVEALKMLLTSLGYDADVEKMQNVGAAWKANTLNLAKKVGLLDRVYADTNKPCTRDDVALLIFNFLNSEVVNGYLANNVPSNTQWFDKTGTALEVYFGKQIIFGIITANEAADLDVHEYAKTGTVVNNDVTLGAGKTELFLTDNAKGYTLKEVINGAAGNDVDKYFMTVELSTDLEDIGESVFVVTSVEPVKGKYVAEGGVYYSAFKAGEVYWQPVPAKIAVGALVFHDYDLTDVDTTIGNGDYVKLVDTNGDGKNDLVIHENWAMTQVGVPTADGTLSNLANEPMNTKTNYVGDTNAIVNWHYADGTYYGTKAPVVTSALADDLDAVNYKYGYVTLATGDKYYQSDVNVAVPETLTTKLMDCKADPKETVNYVWYLDNGGFVRCFGKYVHEDPKEYYLLTDASCTPTRTTYEKTVDAAHLSNEIVTYNTDAKTAFIRNGDSKWDMLNGALNGKAVTNLATGKVKDSDITLGDAGLIVELNREYGKYGNEYKLTNSFGSYGSYNASLGAALNGIDHVYCTNDTVYYVVTLAGRTLNGKPIVKSVEFVEGYKNLNMSLDDCTAAYAQVTNKGEYFLANIVVLETFGAANVPTVRTPMFVYEHISSRGDNHTGLFAALDEEGKETTIDVAAFENPCVVYDQVLGFVSYDTEKVATGLETVKNAYVANVKLVLNDYYVLTSIAGDQIEVTEDTPIWALVSVKTNNGGEKVVVTDKYTKMCAGDQVIVVTNGRGNVTYVLVVSGQDSKLTTEGLAFASDAVKNAIVAQVNGTNNADYKLAVLCAAAKAFGANETVANYETLLKAIVNYAQAMDWDINDLYDWADDLWYSTDPEEEYIADAILDAIGEFGNHIGAKMYDFSEALDTAYDEDGNIVVDVVDIAWIDEAYESITDTEWYLITSLAPDAGMYITALKVDVSEIPAGLVDLAKTIAADVEAYLEATEHTYIGEDIAYAKLAEDVAKWDAMNMTGYTYSAKEMDETILA